MVVILLDNIFSDKLISGEKTQAIRRKHQFRAGLKIALYTCSPTCKAYPFNSKYIWRNEGIITDIAYVIIYKDSVLVQSMGHFQPVDKEEFAKKEGFKSFKRMKSYIVLVHGELPFDGVLIEWRTT